jgi:GAF domain-containing protein
VHDPVSGQTIGLIDLSSLWKIAHPRSLELVTAAARTIERSLVDARRDRDARLRRRYSDFMTRSTDLLVDRDGYVLDGAELAHSSAFDIPEGGGDIVLGDGSVAVAAPLGRGEAYLVRQPTARHAESAPAANGLERAEERARELATEQAALRQVATLVAREPSPDQLFAVVAEQVARVFDAPLVRLVRYESDGSVVVGGFSEGDGEPFPIGSRWPLDSPGVIATVGQTGRPARVEDYAHVTGEIAAVIRGAGMRSAVATPIAVQRRLWGAMVVLSPRHEPFPEDTEARLTDFTELVATAIANSESRVAIGRLVDEQAALRRVATLVARGTEPVTVFGAVCDEVQALLGADRAGILRFHHDRTVTVMASSRGPGQHGVGARVSFDPGFVVDWVHETHHAARFDTDDPAAADMPEVVRTLGVRSAVGSPIVVDGELWGVITLASVDRSLPLEMERRLADFTELVATAIANAESREALARLAEEQAALRRVATLVAEDVPSGELCAAVVQEAGTLLDADYAGMIRYEDDPTVTALASWAATGELPPIPDRFRTEPGDPTTMVAETRQPARVDDWTVVPGPLAAFLRDDLAVRSSVGSPIMVEGRLWGILGVHSKGHVPLPPDTESRIGQFTELVATAIANREARTEVARLADEQAALRRVATLVARDAAREEVFTAIASEIGHLFGLEKIRMVRYEDDRTVVVVASSGPTEALFPVGSSFSVDADSAASRVFRTGEPARIDDYGTVTGAIAEVAHSVGNRGVVAAPISVEGRLWGAITARTTQDEPLPPATESRLGQFTELMATAVANAEGKSELAASRRRIVAASDEARRRFERDLHDGVQQRLVTLALEVRSAEALASGETGELGDQLGKVGDGLAGALDDLRELSRGIHPAILSEGGLVPALKVLSRRSAVPVALDLAVDQRLPDQIEVAAYYVVSETLTNVAKHASASEVDVRARLADGALELTIEDDGVGGAEPAGGSGLTGLADRVEAVGGTIAITSPRDGGTSLRVHLPLSP